MARGNVPGRTVLRSQTPDLISVQHALLSCILLAKASLLASCRGRFITKTKDIMRQSDFPTRLRKIREVRLDRVQGNLIRIETSSRSGLLLSPRLALSRSSQSATSTAFA
jgi:hypothetical protein